MGNQCSCRHLFGSCYQYRDPLSANGQLQREARRQPSTQALFDLAVQANDNTRLVDVLNRRFGGGNSEAWISPLAVRNLVCQETAPNCGSASVASAINSCGEGIIARVTARDVHVQYRRKGCCKLWGGRRCGLRGLMNTSRVGNEKVAAVIRSWRDMNVNRLQMSPRNLREAWRVFTEAFQKPGSVILFHGPNHYCLVPGYVGPASYESGKCFILYTKGCQMPRRLMPFEEACRVLRSGRNKRMSRVWYGGSANRSGRGVKRPRSDQESCQDSRLRASSSTAAAEGCKWRVTYRGGRRIWTQPNGSRVTGTHQTRFGGVFRGIQVDGTWVKLADGTGYVRIIGPRGGRLLQRQE